MVMPTAGRSLACGPVRGLGWVSFPLVKPEPTRGLEPRTYRLQDSFSTPIIAATSSFNVYSDRPGGRGGSGGRTRRGTRSPWCTSRRTLAPGSGVAAARTETQQPRRSRRGYRPRGTRRVRSRTRQLQGRAHRCCRETLGVKVVADSHTLVRYLVDPGRLSEPAVS